MLRARPTTLAGTALLRLSSACSSKFRPANAFDGSIQDAEAYEKMEPLLFKGAFCRIPAINKWFASSATQHDLHEVRESYLNKYEFAIVPLELTRFCNSDSSAAETASFERFEAPLSLLISYLASTDRSLALYLAQCPLVNLPFDLQADLPTPNILSRLGRGDIYASSLWMGRPPTRTPLHRDPNPNLFVQLAGTKVVRLIRPDKGRQVYDRCKAGDGHANMRGEEMMIGNEMNSLEKSVWDCDSELSRDIVGVEAILHSGDGLLIPNGWWHAVHGIGMGVNASVNWWFR